MIAQLVVLAVAGAPAAQECEWPSVATFRVGDTKCSATLVHPRVVLTAAHCLELGDTGRMRFGEEFSPYEMRIDVERCVKRPEYFATRSPSDDYAACILTEPAEGIPIVPVAMGCDTEGIVAGAQAAIVGYGLPSLGEDFGIKHWASTVIDERERPVGLVDVGDAEVNGCLGDSGGPGFVRLPDGTWRAFGILVAGPECGEGPSTFATMHDRMAWFEEATGFDLTPCHDADGTWNPGPDCAEFSLDPLDSTPTWETACAAETFEPTTECPEGLTAPTEPEAEPDPQPEEPAAPPSSGACALGAHRPAAWLPLLLLLVAHRRSKPPRK